MTSEEITAKRRADRKQFKADRAKAIAAVAEEAELIFATEGRVVAPALSGPAIPSAATWKPSSQTPPEDPVPSEQDPVASDQENETEDDLVDIEHLQLTLQEAFFLCWTLDCLTILDPHTSEPMSLEQIWLSFQRVHLPPFISLTPSIETPLQFDNPFLIHYMVYHHYRSLGWVIKGGIKFCVDYLLYKRGPVFAHAEYVRPCRPTIIASCLLDSQWSCAQYMKILLTRFNLILILKILPHSPGHGSVQ
jgi:tRNA-splicing endonuclease subunit Sen2